MHPEIESFAAHLARVERASPQTQRAYVSDLRQLAAFLDERGTPLDAATRDDLRAFLASRFSASTASTLARKQASVRAFYEHRVRIGHIADSPARRLAFPRRRLSLPNVVNVDDCAAIVEAPSGRTPAGLRDRAALELLYGAGLRVSELVGLDLADVSSDSVRVRGKGNKERMVPMVSKARAALDAYLARRSELRPSGGALFLNRRGGRLSRRGASDIFTAIAANAGLDDKTTAHVGRHTFVNELIRGGEDLILVAEIAGHARLETLRVYSQPTDDDKHNALHHLTVDR